LFTDAYRITLKGKGFDAFRTNKNTVTFQTASTAPEVKGLTSKSSITSVVISFTHLTPHGGDSKTNTNQRGLLAVVTVSELWSTGSID